MAFPWKFGDSVALLPLPIDAVLPELVAALRAGPNGVLQAATGAGKTTRVPPALLDAGLAGEKLIVMLEPRRLAARAAAYRMAEERGSAVGEEIGYQVRFERKSSARTRILAVTEGVLIRMLRDDPFLERIGVVIFDEFHERSLDTDLALAMCRRVQQTVRGDLKIVVMSATLTPGPIAEYLGGARTVRSEGKLFPVELEYGGQGETRSTLEPMRAGVERLLKKTTGDLLVFLPGIGEIRKGLDELRGMSERGGFSLYGLSGEMSVEDQHAVLKPSDRRKVILTTNVAETSVTVPGVTGVIDSGMARVMRQDPGTGLNQLQLERISQASADQRMGRAGRTQPGVCLRLWNEREQRGMAAETVPEIERVDLAGVILELLCWGETNLEDFPWFEKPRTEGLRQGMMLLEQLGAVNEGEATELGREMVRLPVHPRLARLLIEGARLGHAEIAAWGAALLAERDPFVREKFDPQAKPSITAESDVWERITAVRNFLERRERTSSAGTVQPGGAFQMQQAQRQLLRGIEELNIKPASKKTNAEEALLRGILAAFPDRVARRRESRGLKALMVGGRGVRIDGKSLVHEPELFVCVDLDGGQGEAWGRMLSGIRAEWLPEEKLIRRTVREFDEAQGRVTASRQVMYEDLAIEEKSIPVPADEETAALLAEAAARDPGRALTLDEPKTAQLIARINCLGEWMPELGLLVIDEEFWRVQLPNLATGCRSFADLRGKSLIDWLRGVLTYPQWQAIEKEAPERLPVPSGNSITLTYEAGRPPVLAARIQELFGLAETPRVAGGRVKVLLHLLAPNYRPQQVTDDLKSFWNTTYQQVRKELRARYPKHAWPEDPWTAQAQKRPGRKN